MDRTLFDLEHHVPGTPRDFDPKVGESVLGIIRSVDAEMRRQPASMVYEMIRQRVEGRRPPVDVDHEVLREAAARIAVGLPV